MYNDFKYSVYIKIGYVIFCPFIDLTFIMNKDHCKYVRYKQNQKPFNVPFLYTIALSFTFKGIRV